MWCVCVFVCVLVAFLGVIINDDERWETPRTRQGANTDSSRTGSNQVREDVDEVLRQCQLRRAACRYVR